MHFRYEFDFGNIEAQKASLNVTGDFKKRYRVASQLNEIQPCSPQLQQVALTEEQTYEYDLPLSHVQSAGAQTQNKRITSDYQAHFSKLNEKLINSIVSSPQVQRIDSNQSAWYQVNPQNGQPFQNQSQKGSGDHPNEDAHILNFFKQHGVMTPPDSAAAGAFQSGIPCHPQGEDQAHFRLTFSSNFQNLPCSQEAMNRAMLAKQAYPGVSSVTSPTAKHRQLVLVSPTTGDRGSNTVISSDEEPCYQNLQLQCNPDLLHTTGSTGGSSQQSTYATSAILSREGKQFKSSSRVEGGKQFPVISKPTCYSTINAQSYNEAASKPAAPVTLTRTSQGPQTQPRLSKHTQLTIQHRKYSFLKKMQIEAQSILMNNSGVGSNDENHKHSRNEISIEIESDSSNLNIDQSRVLNQSNNKYELSVKDSQRLRQMIAQQHQSRQSSKRRLADQCPQSSQDQDFYQSTQEQTDTEIMRSVKGDTLKRRNLPQQQKYQQYQKECLYLI